MAAGRPSIKDSEGPRLCNIGARLAAGIHGGQPTLLRLALATARCDEKPELAALSVIRAIMPVMTRWQDVEEAAPEFAQRVRALFDAHRHKTLATVRADGAPRISGIETVFEDGELVFGSMPNARKGADLRRDPRFALHSATIDPIEGAEAQWPGEAKISGRVIAAGPISEGPDGDSFRADIGEVVHTHLNEAATLLVIEWWTPARGLQRIERE